MKRFPCEKNTGTKAKKNRPLFCMHFPLTKSVICGACWKRRNKTYICNKCLNKWSYKHRLNFMEFLFAYRILVNFINIYCVYHGRVSLWTQKQNCFPPWIGDCEISCFYYRAFNHLIMNLAIFSKKMYLQKKNYCFIYLIETIKCKIHGINFKLLARLEMNQLLIWFVIRSSYMTESSDSASVVNSIVSRQHCANCKIKLVSISINNIKKWIFQPSQCWMIQEKRDFPEVRRK